MIFTVGFPSQLMIWCEHAVPHGGQLLQVDPWACLNSMDWVLLCFRLHFQLLLTKLETESSRYKSCQQTQCQWQFSRHLDRYTVHCTLGLSWRPHCTVSHACKRECCLFQSCHSDGTECTFIIWTDSSIFPSKVHVSCTFRQLITLRSSYQNDHLRIKILVSQIMDMSGIIMYQPS